MTYESAVLAMLVDYCVCESPGTVKNGRCVVHPAKKRPYFTGTPGITYAARVNIILASLSAEDHAADNGSLKSRAAVSAWKSAVRKASGELPELYAYIRDELSALRELEKSGCRDVDDFAAPFGRILGRIFTVDGMISERYSDPMYRLGFSLGQWIILIDALDDRSRDRRKENYNIYNLIHGNAALSETDDTVRLRCMLEAYDCWNEIKRLRNSEDYTEPVTEGFMENLFAEGLPHADRTVSEAAQEAGSENGRKKNGKSAAEKDRVSGEEANGPV